MTHLYLNLFLYEAETYTQHMRIVQIKPIWGLFCMKEDRPLKVVPICAVTGNPLTHHLMCPLVCCGNKCTTKHGQFI